MTESCEESLALESKDSGEILHMHNIYVGNKIHAMMASDEHSEGLSFASGQNYIDVSVPLEVFKRQ